MRGSRGCSITGVDLALILGFALVVAPLVMTPGASLALTTTYAVQGGAGAVARCIAGTGLGIVIHAVAAGLGLAAVVMGSAQAYRFVQLAGAAYLLLLGLSMLRPLRHRSAPGRPRRVSLAHGRGPLFTAFVANVLNPKAASVYLTLAPQFMTAESAGLSATLVLAMVHIALMGTWLSGWGLGLVAMAGRSVFDRLGTWIRHVGGVVLVALGVRSCAAA